MLLPHSFCRLDLCATFLLKGLRWHVLLLIQLFLFLIIECCHNHHLVILILFGILSYDCIFWGQFLSILSSWDFGNFYPTDWVDLRSIHNFSFVYTRVILSIWIVLRHIKVFAFFLLHKKTILLFLFLDLRKLIVGTWAIQEPIVNDSIGCGLDLGISGQGQGRKSRLINSWQINVFNCFDILSRFSAFNTTPSFDYLSTCCVKSLRYQLFWQTIAYRWRT
jgi:hypothetical protein